MILPHDERVVAESSLPHINSVVVSSFSESVVLNCSSVDDAVAEMARVVDLVSVETESFIKLFILVIL